METYPRIQYQESVEPMDDSNTVVKKIPIFPLFFVKKVQYSFQNSEKNFTRLASNPLTSDKGRW